MRGASNYPISQLLDQIIRESGLRRSAFVQSLGYQNVTGGLRKLDEWLDHGSGDNGIIDRIAKVYQPYCAELEIALLATQTEHDVEYEAVCQAQEIQGRRTFRPYIFIETSRSVPTQITIAALMGAPMKFIKLPGDVVDRSDDEQIAAVSNLIRFHYAEMEGRCFMFGHITGYRFVNSYDTSIRFSIDGRIVERISKHFRPPATMLQVGKKRIDTTGTGLFQRSLWLVKESHADRSSCNARESAKREEGLVREASKGVSRCECSWRKQQAVAQFSAYATRALSKTRSKPVSSFE